MLFNSPVFLFAFLPQVLLAYYLVPFRFKNGILLFFSLLFYAWGEAVYLAIMIFSIGFNYLIGREVDRRTHQKHKKSIITFGIAGNLTLLASFKYLAFFSESINSLIIPVLGTSLPEPRLHLPIGISFFTFQAISYIVDVYRGEVKAQGSLLKLGLYISLFPQLVAGPIVRYHHINQQLNHRTHSWDKFFYGIQRFAIGLGKKVLIANNMAYVADQAFQLAPDQLSFLPAWLGIIAYSLQIYFDFAGYSDMAIGLGSMFGFRFLENFNFPYISRSIREFWRRWHISLSTWFRDYLYIPLGGNRLSNSRTALNLIIVFFLTGLWHGNSFNFIVWGLFHGFFLILERGKFGKYLEQNSRFSHFYTLLIVVTAWVFFRSPDLGHAWGYMQAMFVPHFTLVGKALSGFLLDPEKWLFLLLGIFFSTPIVVRQLLPYFRKVLNETTFAILKSGFILALLLLCTMYIASDTYSPFIYFRF